MIQPPAESLNDIGVLVTRPAHQARPFMELLRGRGARPVDFPVMDIRPPQNTAALQRTLAGLERYDMLIFISANAVEHGLNSIAEAGQQVSQTVAAIGESTAAALRDKGVQVQVQPQSGFNSEALLADPAFSADALAGKSVLVVRGEGGRELLARSLTSRGARVDYAEVYRRCRPDSDDSPLNALWHDDRIQIVTVTSNESLKNLYDMLSENTRSCLLGTPLLVPGSRCAELARQLGFQADILTATNATDQAMLERLQQWHNDNQPGR